MHADEVEDAGGEGEDAGHTADRGPTPEEEAVADRVAATVDLREVTEHEKDMARKGAKAKGEGAIE